MKSCILVALVFFLESCTLSQPKILLKTAQEKAQSKEWDSALHEYEKLVRGYPRTEEARRGMEEASIISRDHQQDYARLQRMLQELIGQTSDTVLLHRFLSQLLDIQFEKRALYSEAIPTAHRLIEMKLSEGEEYTVRTQLAKSYFYTQQFDQAIVEIQNLEPLTKEDSEKIQILLLKANIYLGQKKYALGIQALEKLIRDYPSSADLDQAVLTLVSAQEEAGDLTASLQTLQKYQQKSTALKEFFHRKAEQLEEKKSILPGARGRKK